jgi:hypothetical protein
MANTYQWAVNSMTAYPEFEGETDVVFQVSWVCSATDGNGHNAATYGTTDVTYEAGTPFTPYNELTLEQVLGWVFAALGPEGVAKAEADCDEQIAKQLEPAPINPPLPWNQPAPEPAA